MVFPKQIPQLEKPDKALQIHLRAPNPHSLPSYSSVLSFPKLPELDAWASQPAPKSHVVLVVRSPAYYIFNSSENGVSDGSLPVQLLILQTPVISGQDH